MTWEVAVVVIAAIFSTVAAVWKMMSKASDEDVLTYRIDHLEKRMISLEMKLDAQHDKTSTDVVSLKTDVARAFAALNSKENRHDP